MRSATLAAAVLLSACSSIGYSPEQLKALPNGAVMCAYARGFQGSAGGVTVNTEEVARSRVSSESEITISPEQGCQTTIKGKAVSVVPPAPASARVGGAP